MVLYSTDLSAVALAKADSGGTEQQFLELFLLVAMVRVRARGTSRPSEIGPARDEGHPADVFLDFWRQICQVKQWRKDRWFDPVPSRQRRF